MTNAVSSSKAGRQWLWVGTALALVWLVCEIVVNPVGNFPLNDDWSFAVGVKNLVDTGRLTITCWTLTGSVFHVASAAAVCALFGFSFDVLRCYTLAMAAIQIGCLGWMIKRLLNKPWMVLFALLCLLLNPLFFSLANTFMTDVPTSTLVLLGLCFLGEYGKRDSIGFWLAGTVACICAVSNRQVLIILPICFLLTELIGRRALCPAATVNPTKRIVLAITPLLAGLAVIYAHMYWLDHGPGTPFCMVVERTWINKLLHDSPKVYFSAVVAGVLRWNCYLGTIMLPLILCTLPSIIGNVDDKKRKLFVLLAIELFLLVPLGLLFCGAIMPLGDNVIFDFGLGPILLCKDAAPPWTHTSPLLWIAVTIFGGLGLAALAVELAAIVRNLLQACKSKKLGGTGYTVLFALLFSFVYVGVICLRGFFDRYLVQMLAALVIVLVGGAAGVFADDDVEKPSGEQVSQRTEEPLSSATSRRKLPIDLVCQILSGISLLVLAIYSVAATHDYFAWERAAWDLFGNVMSERNPKTDQAILPSRINGTYEFNHWYVYEPGNKVVDVHKNDEPVGNDDFKIALQPYEGYKPFMERSFHSFLWGDRLMFLLQKK